MNRFPRFRDLIQTTRLDSPDQRLLMDQQGKVAIYYAPFDYINSAAKIVVVGICPSLLRYPVFVDGKKYAGSPDMTRHPLLRRYVFDYFVTEMNQIRDALIVGLGPRVWKVLDFLAGEGLIDSNRILNGILHGSPENTYRIQYMTGDRASPAPWRTDPEAYDRGRMSFRQRASCLDNRHHPRPFA